jgi:hypothetical protein
MTGKMKIKIYDYPDPQKGSSQQDLSGPETALMHWPKETPEGRLRPWQNSRQSGHKGLPKANS